MKTVWALLIMLFTSGAASAATVAYDFSLLDGEAQTPSYSYAVDGLALTMTSSGGDINFGADGLGVAGNPGGGRLAGGESITFDFGTTPLSDISGVVFEKSKGPESFQVVIGTTVLDYNIPAGKGGTTLSLDFATALDLNDNITSFTIISTTPRSKGRHGINISGITVTTLSVVPLPMAGWLLLSGVGSLMITRRRRRAEVM